MSQDALRPVAGLATIVAIAGIVLFAVTMFRGDFTETVPLTVVSPRAGLVIDPDAKAKMYGVQVGKVDSIQELPGGQALLHLAMDPTNMHTIPAHAAVSITPPTV